MGKVLSFTPTPPHGSAILPVSRPDPCDSSGRADVESCKCEQEGGVGVGLQQTTVTVPEVGSPRSIAVIYTQAAGDAPTTFGQAVIEAVRRGRAGPPDSWIPVYAIGSGFPVEVVSKMAAEGIHWSDRAKTTEPSAVDVGELKARLVSEYMERRRQAEEWRAQKLAYAASGPAPNPNPYHSPPAGLSEDVSRLLIDWIVDTGNEK